MIINLTKNDGVKVFNIIDFDDIIAVPGINGDPDWSIEVQAAFYIPFFLTMFPTLPSLDGIDAVTYQPNDDMYHVQFENGDFLVSPQPKGNAVLEWIHENRIEVYAAGRNSRLKEIGII